MKPFEDKTVLITGSSRGIGAATAKLAYEYGAKVILHGHTDSDHLHALAKELNGPHIFGDVADKKLVEGNVNNVIQSVGKIDVLINCAGIVVPQPFLESGDENWLDQYRVNVLGIVHFCQAIIPHMQKNGYGRIVNIASIRGHEAAATPRGMAYAASKAAVRNLTAALAKEYAPHIAVNAVSPGFTLTDMSKTWNETVWNQVKTTLVERAAKPEEIAEVLLFLASDKASYITGQTVLADGGYTISGK